MRPVKTGLPNPYSLRPVRLPPWSPVQSMRRQRMRSSAAIPVQVPKRIPPTVTQRYTRDRFRDASQSSRW